MDLPTKAISAAQHTPGPWRAEREADNYYVYDQTYGAGVVIAKVGVGRAMYNQENNARLIAAAPDMLAALQRFAHAMEQRSYPELQGIASDAFAALAKAGA